MASPFYRSAKAYTQFVERNIDVDPEVTRISIPLSAPISLSPV